MGEARADFPCVVAGTVRRSCGGWLAASDPREQGLGGRGVLRRYLLQMCGGAVEICGGGMHNAVADLCAQVLKPPRLQGSGPLLASQVLIAHAPGAGAAASPSSSHVLLRSHGCCRPSHAPVAGALVNALRLSCGSVGRGDENEIRLVVCSTTERMRTYVLFFF